jgi:hypothetical protein
MHFECEFVPKHMMNANRSSDVLSLLHAFDLRAVTADFHSAEKVTLSSFSTHFLLNCNSLIQISGHISKESERKKLIALHFLLTRNPHLG